MILQIFLAKGESSHNELNTPIITTGEPRFPDPEEVSEDEIKDLNKVAAIFKLSHLQTICNNLLTEQEFLNPSIGTFLNDETGAKMKELFFNQSERADVVFNVEGMFFIATMTLTMSPKVAKYSLTSSNCSDSK